MCGIAGIREFTKNKFSRNIIESMTGIIAHRGPDAEGLFTDEGKIALGHRRLAIIDISEDSNQPFTDNTGRFVMVFNGEIYNYLEIKKQIPDYHFRTNSDTEVILAAYIKWGKTCLSMLNGMFALAIWDKEKETLFIARDRLGIKPFYYFQDDQTFIFGSEMRSILESGLVERKLDTYGLVDYLKYQTVHAPNTIIKGVKQLLPGECGIVGANRLQKEMYWNLSEHNKVEEDNLLAIKANVKNLFIKGVERRMISDVPIGAFLSGGIDSSAIVAAMAEVSESSIRTFSIGFKEQQFDESYYAKLIAKKYNTIHTNIKLSSTDFLKELPTILESLDVPSGDGANSYIVSRMTKDAGIKVALSGLGGDELFAGYGIFNRYKKIHHLRSLWKIPQKVRKILSRTLPLISNSNQTEKMMDLITAPSANFFDTYPLFRRVLSEKGIQNLTLELPVKFNLLRDQFVEKKDEINKLPLLSQVSYGEISGYTQNVLLRDTDQMSMAHALEVRVPFFDHKLVEYVLGIPDEFKNPKSPKKLLVDSLSPWLPDEIVNRPKMGFSFPWENWIKSDLKELCEKNLFYLAETEYFEKSNLIGYWNKFLGGDSKINWSKIWVLVVLGGWLKKNEIH